MEEITKESLSLAGEYAVASELCKRGHYAQLTLGTRKKTDILVDSESGMLHVQVKSKQKDPWPCQGVFGKGIVLVLVDYKNKTLEERPDFYILDPADWKRFVKSGWVAERVVDGRCRLDAENCPIWGEQGKRQFRGVQVKPEDVTRHKEKWGKIDAILAAKRNP